MLTIVMIIIMSIDTHIANCQFFCQKTLPECPAHYNTYFIIYKLASVKKDLNYNDLQLTI